MELEKPEYQLRQFLVVGRPRSTPPSLSVRVNAAGRAHPDLNGVRLKVWVLRVSLNTKRV